MGMLLCMRQQQAGRPARARTPAARPGADRAACSCTRRAQDITVLHVKPICSWTSYMVFATVFSKPQLLAVLARIEDMAAEEGGRPRLNQPGSSPWECLDYGDTVVHIFTAEQRCV